MLRNTSSQLLSLLSTNFLLSFTAFAQGPNWLFPADLRNTSGYSYIFESQDIIAASWISDFVGPMLYIFCQADSIPGWHFSEYILDAHLFLDLIARSSIDDAFYSGFRSPAAVLPSASYAIPLETVQNTSNCHLNLNETNGPVVRDYTSDSGSFLVNVEYVFFRYSPLTSNKILSLRDVGCL